jgi:hypothetical protein
MANVGLQWRLGQRVDAWRRIGADSTILDWVVHGVPLTFIDEPCKTFFPNPEFKKEHRVFIKEELIKLVRNGAIELCSQKPRYVSPLTVVPKKNNKLRMILNLKSLNKTIAVSRFRSEDIRETIDMLEYNDQMTTIDIKDCFYHMRIHPKYREYLGFSFGGQFYRFCVCPFGLNMSPFYCNKLIRPVIAYARSCLNIRCQVYVDDFLICASKTEITDHTDSVLQILADVGWLVNMEKSFLVPSSVRT